MNREESKPFQLVDIGCNLSHESFDADRDQVIARAREAGVVQMIVTGASEHGSIKALDIARSHPGELFATAGVHPHLASEFNAETESVLRELCDQGEVVAVGETGLDYFRDFSPRDHQKSAFERQLQIAVDCGKPLFLHQRDAHADFIAILRGFRDRLHEVVVHCFTGTQAEMHECLDLGCHIGITGWICDERRGTHMQAYMKDIPSDRLLIETDAPYLKPRDLRPRVKTHRNEPCWLPWIASTLANCRGESPGKLAGFTTANARRFFRLPASGADTA
jgi:TatD DNase family protein